MTEYMQLTDGTDVRVEASEFMPGRRAIYAPNDQARPEEPDEWGSIIVTDEYTGEQLEPSMRDMERIEEALAERLSEWE